LSFTALAHASPAAEPLGRVTLVLGGARAGKSRFAETLAASRPGRRVYLATAAAGDAEMAERIRRHRARRGAGWTTVEEPLDLAGALAARGSEGATVLVDCLTLWLSNLMQAGRNPAAEIGRLVTALARRDGPVILVSNEVGLGIVPDNAVARAFRDHAGRLHQAVAAVADRVYFMAAGLPLLLKDATAAQHSPAMPAPPAAPSRKRRGVQQSTSPPPLRGRVRVGAKRGRRAAP
jgi:adenosylcobinamide kinase/adenosylcobinamide-phosphate guanylyltransferase